jgi:hypothetical protein
MPDNTNTELRRRLCLVAATAASIGFVLFMTVVR